jgi:hypothetical protein
MARFLTTFLLGLILLALAAPVSAATLFVAPEGRDTWSGSEARPNAAQSDGPLASLEGARNRVRQLQQSGPLSEPVLVVIAEGTYPLLETVVFTPEDSGTATAPIIYQAAPEARPLFDGGRVLEGFRPLGGGVWALTLPEVREGRWYFEQLWVNGRRATRARSPNQSCFVVANPVTDAPGLPPDTPAEFDKRAFFAWPPDIGLLGRMPANQLPDVNLVAYHAWETSRHRIASADPASGLVVLSGPSLWTFRQWDLNQRFYLENFKAALDAPGEWFLDRDGTLYYLPLPGEDMATAMVVAPAGQAQFVRFAGQPVQNRQVAHITLRGLAFRHGQYLLPAGGHADGQAEISIPAAIEAEGASDIRIEDCEIGHVGISAIWFHRGSNDCLVSRCFLHDLGGGGVRIGDGLEQDLTSPTMATGGVTVEESIIHAGGRIHAGAVGVWIGRSGDNRVAHNDISDFFYTGISVGWIWGYSVSPAVRNNIEFNRVHHLGQGVLSDLGGIYTLGPSPGTRIRHNVIHDIDAYDYGGWGIYADEGTSDVVIENNLVYNTRSGSFHQHYGRDNLIRNNVFCNGREGQIQRSRVENHLAFVFRNNILYWTEGALAAAGSISDPKVRFEQNLYWNPTGRPVDFQGQNLAQRQASGLDLGSIIADPLFVDPVHDDFRLRPNSPALRIGFQAIDYSLAGVSRPEAARVNTLVLPVSQPRPPQAVHDDFETSLPGAPPAFTRIDSDGRRGLVAVTDEGGAGGSRRSLAITDAEGLPHIYNPHFYYDPGHREGVTTCRFDMRIEDGVVMYHQWRDDLTPYHVGPSFWVRAGELELGGRRVLSLPNGQWINFQVSAGIGSASSGTWDLAVTLPGEPPLRFNGLANGSPLWKTLDWLGFSSMAADRRVFYLDNLHVENSPQDRTPGSGGFDRDE